MNDTVPKRFTDSDGRPEVSVNAFLRSGHFYAFGYIDLRQVGWGAKSGLVKPVR